MIDCCSFKENVASLIQRFANRWNHGSKVSTQGPLVWDLFVITQFKALMVVLLQVISSWVNTSSTSVTMGGLIVIVQCCYSLQRDSWSTPVMKSLWWEPESHLAANRSDGFKNHTDCFNSTQSTVLKGLEFGGVPDVLLINFVVFVVCFCPFLIYFWWRETWLQIL